MKQGKMQVALHAVFSWKSSNRDIILASPIELYCLAKPQDSFTTACDHEKFHHSTPLDELHAPVQQKLQDHIDQPKIRTIM